MGCEMAQGFFLGRPAPAEVLERLLRLRGADTQVARSAR
jgi:EAL domain-containing protein (putative c-di-GMP-specific phosphodiesterase class I)